MFFYFATLLISLIYAQKILKPFNDPSYAVHWNINEEKGLINFNITCKTDGWVGLGISDTGRMLDSDLNICYMDKNKKVICADGYAKSYSFTRDTALGGQDNISNVTGSAENGTLTVSFSKPLNSGDKYDKVIMKGRDISVLFSYRVKGNPATENGQFNQHTYMTSQQIVLWEGNATDSNSTNVINDKDNYNIGLGFGKISLPNKETYYVCQHFNLSSLIKNKTGLDGNTKYHATSFIPQLDNVKHLHHLVVFGCPVVKQIKNFTFQPFDCTADPMPECDTFQVAWAPGMRPIILPQQTGMLLGAGDTSMVMLQIHYNNPELVSGQFDNSNITINFTPKLRQYNTGIMALGTYFPLISIPPGQPSYSVVSQCTSNCTSHMKGNINIFAYVSHGHLIAKSVYSVFSGANGKIATLGERTFNFHEQVVRTVEPMVALEPGFSATTICTYDSTGKNNTISGGVGSTDEMCYNFIFYYPKENAFSYCMDVELGTKEGCVANVDN
jgi:dopamine beta-monooxygenase